MKNINLKTTGLFLVLLCAAGNSNAAAFDSDDDASVGQQGAVRRFSQTEGPAVVTLAQDHAEEEDLTAESVAPHILIELDRKISAFTEALDQSFESPEFLRSFRNMTAQYALFGSDNENEDSLQRAQYALNFDEYKGKIFEKRTKKFAAEREKFVSGVTKSLYGINRQVSREFQQYAEDIQRSAERKARAQEEEELRKAEERTRAQQAAERQRQEASEIAQEEERRVQAERQRCVNWLRDNSGINVETLTLLYAHEFRAEAGVILNEKGTSYPSPADLEEAGQRMISRRFPVFALDYMPTEADLEFYREKSQNSLSQEEVLAYLQSQMVQPRQDSQASEVSGISEQEPRPFDEKISGQPAMQRRADDFSHRGADSRELRATRTEITTTRQDFEGGGSHSVALVSKLRRIHLHEQNPEAKARLAEFVERLKRERTSDGVRRIFEEAKEEFSGASSFDA